MTDVSAFVVLVLSPSSETKLLFPTRRRFRRGGVATELKVYLMFVLVLFVLSLQSQHTHTHTHTHTKLTSFQRADFFENWTPHESSHFYEDAMGKDEYVRDDEVFR